MVAISEVAPAIDICFPDDQQEGTEATVAQWLVKAGDKVAAHDPVVEIETDKVVVEVAAPEAGKIGEIRIEQDGEVLPGNVLCTLVTEAAGLDSSQDSSKHESANHKAHYQQTAEHLQSGLSPAVKQRVMQHDLDISGVQGSGRDGRITLQDVETLIASGTTSARQSDSMKSQNDLWRPRSASEAGDAGQQNKASSQSPNKALTQGVGSDIVPHNKMRKRIAENMVASLMHSAPHVTAVFEADLSAVMKHLKDHKDAFKKCATPLTLTTYFVAATISALQKVPQVNSRWFDDHLEIFHAIHLGIGTALGDQGLIVPVLHHAEMMNLKDIAKALTDVTERARSNQLKPEDVRGGTFTISNHGVSGSLIATPIIINQPQSAILGVGKIEKRVIVKEIDGEDIIAIRPMCYVSLTIDHRVIDGHQTNAFLTELVNTLENWS